MKYRYVDGVCFLFDLSIDVHVRVNLHFLDMNCNSLFHNTCHTLPQTIRETVLETFPDHDFLGKVHAVMNELLMHLCY